MPRTIRIDGISAAAFCSHNSDFDKPRHHVRGTSARLEISVFKAMHLQLSKSGLIRKI